MADNETVTMRLPSGETVDLVVPKGMSDDQVRSLYAQKFPKDFASAKAQTPVATGTMTAAPTGVGPWLQNLENDVRTGSGSTLPGRMLQKLGARGTDTGISGTNPLQQTALGPIHMAQGIASTPDHPVMGPLKAVGGALEAANIPLSFMGNAPGAAESVMGKTIPAVMKEQAGQKFSQVMAAAHDVPVDVNNAAKVASRTQELAQSGGSMPKVVRDFIRRVTDPDRGPITYAEARDFYSNATRLSADEFNRLTPVMKAQIGKFTEALGNGLGAAASRVGQGENYQGAMAQYAKGAQASNAVGNLKNALTKYALPAGAAGAAGAAGYELSRALIRRE